MQIISSRQHPLCKRVRALHSSKGRKAQREFLIEGGNGVAAALQARAKLSCILATPDRLGQQWSELATASGIETIWIEDELKAYLSEAQSAPDILAIAPIPTPQTDWESNGLLLILDGIADPGNAGTLLRAADAAGADAVICTAGSVDYFAPKVVRSSAGSIFHFPHLDLSGKDAQTIVQVLAAHHIPIITAQAHKGRDCYQMPWPRRCALVLGHETRGISEEFELAASQHATIPLFGRAESLNVAMAGTLLMFAWRQNFGA